MEEFICQACGEDLVAHHPRNLRCPGRRSIYQEAKSLSSSEILASFDARVWARAFVETCERNPSIIADEETMTTWFSNALMRGYDEHYWRSEKYKRSVRRVLVPWWKRWFVPLTNFGR